ncbi:MAG: SLC13/DASS family transporter [Paludibacteraceae bacterium]|nr:SLC13/DASS family transporter [Paludibacteraceae bacterium]MBR6041617.1 SLC13/DASS family transporter [Paludibacteraceae bacterium]
MANKKLISIILCVVASLVALLVPAQVYGIDGLSVVEQRVIAIFILAALLWITEPIPIWTTSVFVMVLMLLTVSSSSFAPFIDANTYALSAEDAASSGKPLLGNLIKYKDIMAAFADPIIMLFMGGFVLAISAGKIGLDGQLAKVLLAPFGKDPKIVMLGFLVVTGIFSMFMSNTATAAMMLAIMNPVFKSMRGEDGTLDRGVVGLAMAIPIGANIGGMGTPIGTPPNAVAMKYLNDPDYLNLGVGFGTWMMVMIPLVLVIFAFAWILLTKMYPFSMEEIKLKIDSNAFANAPKRDKQIICATFAITIFLWVTDRLTGINANIVALVPFAVLSVTGIFTKKDLSLIDWDVLWLVAGGFALGIGLEKTGLAKHMVESIPFGEWSAIVVMVGSGLLCLLMSTFMSNSASAALLLPIMYTVGKGMDLGAYGGVCTMLLGVALSASLAMALPISTPPNALAYSTGNIKQKDMATVGIIVGMFGFALAFAVLICIAGPLNIFG